MATAIRYNVQLTTKQVAFLTEVMDDFIGQRVNAGRRVKGLLAIEEGILKQFNAAEEVEQNS